MNDVVWIKASPRNPATAAQIEVLLAGGGQERAYRHPADGRQYRAGVARRPLFSAQLGFAEQGITGSVKPQTTTIEFSTADPALRAQLAALVWKDAPLTIEAGAEGAVPARILTGKVVDAEFTRAGVTFTAVDATERLDRALASARFAGNGGVEGPTEATGRIKRRSFGYVFNVEGRLLDTANSVYEFGDPAFGFAAWAALRDKGRVGTFTTLNWQGSIAATFNALKASNPAQGGGVVAPSIACAKWWTQPSGPLTADFIGTAGTGGSMQPAAIADAISRLGTGPIVANLAAANALRPAVAGLHIGTEGESFAQALDRLLLGASLLWVPQADGTLAIREWAFDAAAPTLQAEFRGRARTYAPHGQRRIGFQRNERVHSEGEIAGVLLEELTDGGAEIAREDILNAHQQWSAVQNAAGTRPANNATVGAQAGVNLIDSGGSTLADSAIKNVNISIGANGALTNAGGGQVTIDGLGYLGELDATGSENQITNGDFARGLKYWTVQSTGIGVTVNTAASGLPWARYVESPNDPGNPTIILEKKINAPAGSLVYLSGLVEGSHANTSDCRITATIRFLDNNGVYSGTQFNVPVSLTAANTVEKWRVSGVSPANGTKAEIRILFRVKNAATFLRVGELRGATIEEFATVGAQSGVNLKDSLGLALADVQIKNGSITIGANGALANAGGGQVTIGGLGYTGALNATFGADWLSNVLSRPANLSGLVGSEGIKNNLISIGANGALVGAAGGQVTFGGLGGGAIGLLSQVDLSNLAYTSGLLPTSRVVAGLINTNVTIGANGALAGGGGGQVTFGGLGGGAVGLLTALDLSTSYATGLLPVSKAVAALINASVTIGANGALVGGGGGQVTPNGLGLENNADVTKAVSGPAQIVLNYASNGDLTSGMPVYGTFKLTPAGGSHYTSGVTWAVSIDSGTFSGAAPSISGAGAGQLSINSGLNSPDATLRITATYGGKSYPPAFCKIVRATAAASQTGGGGGGGGGSFANDTTLGAFSTSSFVTISDDLSITTGAGITSVSLTAANLSLAPGNVVSGPLGDTNCEVKWQRETSPGTWTDVGAVATANPPPSVNDYESPGFKTPVWGSVTCNRSATGLSASTAYKFRLVGRVSGGNVRPVNVSGEASAQG